MGFDVMKTCRFGRSILAMLGCGGTYVGSEDGKSGKRDDQIRRNEKKLSFRPMVTESEFKIIS
jgi:hypothetical protein